MARFSALLIARGNCPRVAGQRMATSGIFLSVTWRQGLLTGGGKNIRRRLKKSFVNSGTRRRFRNINSKKTARKGERASCRKDNLKGWREGAIQAIELTWFAQKGGRPTLVTTGL